MDAPEQFSPETTMEIVSLAKRITVAEGLDGEIQAELRRHIEDKVRGYVRGEVKLSEGDALLLAKAHFGEAGVIQGMFEGVHGMAHAGSMMRRAAIATVVYLFVENVATNFITSIWDHVEFAQANAGRIFPESMTTVYPSSWIVQFAYFFVVKVAVLLVTWGILRGGKKGAATMMRLRPWSLGVMGILYVLLLMLEHQPVVARFLDPITESPYVRPEWDMAARYLIAAMWLCVSVRIWIGWCEQGVRTMRAVVWGAASWLAYELLVLPLNETFTYMLAGHMGFWETVKLYWEMLSWFPLVILFQLGAALMVGVLLIMWQRRLQVLAG